jgi:hypothetical protein
MIVNDDDLFVLRDVAFWTRGWRSGVPDPSATPDRVIGTRNGR